MTDSSWATDRSQARDESIPAQDPPRRRAREVESGRTVRADRRRWPPRCRESPVPGQARLPRVRGSQEDTTSGSRHTRTGDARHPPRLRRSTPGVVQVVARRRARRHAVVRMAPIEHAGYRRSRFRTSAPSVHQRRRSVGHKLPAAPTAPLRAPAPSAPPPPADPE